MSSSFDSETIACTLIVEFQEDIEILFIITSCFFVLQLRDFAIWFSFATDFTDVDSSIAMFIKAIYDNEFINGRAITFEGS